MPATYNGLNYITVSTINLNGVLNACAYAYYAPRKERRKRPWRSGRLAMTRRGSSFASVCANSSAGASARDGGNGSRATRPRGAHST